MTPSFCAKVWCFWIIACDLLSAFLSALRLVLHVNPWSQWKNLHTSKFGFCVDIYTCLPYVNTYIYYIWLKNDLYCYIISHLHLLSFKKQRILPTKNEKLPRKKKRKKTIFNWPFWYLWPSFQPLEARLRIPTRFLTHLTNLGTAHHIWSWFLRTSKSMGFCFLIHWPKGFFLGGREFPWVEFKGLQKTTHDMGVSQNNGWFIMEKPMKMDGFGVSLFSETPIS